MKVTFHQDGFDELLTGSYANSLLDKEAEPMLDRANDVSSTTDPAATEPYYEMEDGSDGKRARRRIRAAGARAMRHEAKTNALQKALGGA